MSVEARPIGRTCFVSLLPEQHVSPLAAGVPRDSEALVRRGVVTKAGPKCKHVQPGLTYLVRSSLGVVVGDELLLPEVACLALVES